MKVLDVLKDALGAFLAPVMHAGLRSGRYYGGPAATIGNSPVVADVIYWTPMLIPEKTTVVEIGCNVVTTGTATLARLGLYRLAAGTLTAVALPAEFAVTSTGAKPQTVSAPVDPGMYFMGFVANGTITISTDQLNGAAGPAALCGNMHGSATAAGGGNADVGLTTAHTYAALPSPTLALSSTVYGGIIIPHLTYRI